MYKINHLIKTSVYDFVRDGFQVVGDEQPRVYEVAKILVGHYVPDAIACQHQKLVTLVVPVAHEDLGLRRDELLTRASALDVFVLVVAESPRHRQQSVHPLYDDVPTSLLNPLLFCGQHGLMVARREDWVARSAEHGPRVTAISDVDVLR